MRLYKPEERGSTGVYLPDLVYGRKHIDTLYGKIKAKPIEQITDAHPALLLIDLVKEFFDRERIRPEYIAKKPELVSRVNELTIFSRNKGFPVIWVTQQWKKDLSDGSLLGRFKNELQTPEGTEWCEILEEFEVDHNKDYQVAKTKFSGFFESRLDDVLYEIKPDCLIVGGINTPSCVRDTVGDAYNRTIPMELAIDCTFTYDKEQHEVASKYMGYSMAPLKTNEEIFKQFGG